jgi:crotonobetainyl-CoA:carnitine CoA-transferase CaiB-like acyl-CoA transferase
VNIGGVAPGTNGFTFMWELSNRGKRSIGVNLQTPQGKALLDRLLVDADVFLTSFLPKARRSLGIDEASIRAINDRIVYAVGSGQGQRGPDANDGGFDQTSFWYRAGIATGLVDPGAFPPGLPGAGFGDVISGMSLAGGIAAALFRRERTGEAQAVESSLLSTGLWANQGNVTAYSVTGEEFRFPDRHNAMNPLVNTYRTADDRYIGLCVIQSQKHWDEFCIAVGRPDLIDDARFLDQDVRADNRGELVSVLDEVFAGHDLRYWEVALSKQGGQWATIALSTEVATDPQVVANGFVQRVDYGSGRSLEIVPAPVQFNGAPHVVRPAPELGGNTEEVLLDSGVSWDDIVALKDAGVIS